MRLRHGPETFQKRFKALEEHVADTGVGSVRLYTGKVPINSADLLNYKVIPLSDSHGIPLPRILTDRGTGFCGKPDAHDYDRTQPQKGQLSDQVVAAADDRYMQGRVRETVTRFNQFSESDLS